MGDFSVVVSCHSQFLLGICPQGQGNTLVGLVWPSVFFLEQSLSARRQSTAWLARLGTLTLVTALPPLQALGMCVVQNPSGHLAGKVHEEGIADGKNAEAGSGLRDILVTWNFLVAGAIYKQTVAG